jgi:hypothetical protein
MRRALREAFKTMRKNGLVARMNFLCCQNCGITQISDELDEGKHRNKIGYAFFHSQDNSDIENRGEVYIAWGHVKDKPNKIEKKQVSDVICNAIESAGLKVVWDGSSDHRIKATI